LIIIALAVLTMIAVVFAALAVDLLRDAYQIAMS